MLDEFFNNLDNKLNEINQKIDNLKVDKKIEILSTNDIMRIMGINRNTANELFARSDFPAIRGIKSHKVEKQAFYRWLQERKGMILMIEFNTS